MNVIMQTRGQPVHERRPGRDAIRVEMLLFWLLRRQMRPFEQQFRANAVHFVDFLDGFFGCPETPGSLLVHLGTRCDAIYGHIEQFPGTHDAEKTVDALEDSDHHFVFVARGRFVFRVGARVDNAVHVEVQVVELHGIWVWFGCIDWNANAIYVDGLERKEIMWKL